MKVIIISGEPGTGKSSLVKTLLPADSEAFSRGLVKGHRKGSVLFVGIYGTNTKYPGTDRLSMAVQPELLRQIKDEYANAGIHTVVMEGDRITNPSMVSALAELGIHTKVYVLKVDQDVLQARRQKRGDTFDEKWLTGRVTKNRNFAQKAGEVSDACELQNNNQTDMMRNLNTIGAVIFS